MTFVKRLVEIMDTRQETPKNFGSLHFAFIFAALLICAVLVVFFRNARDRDFRIIIGGMFSVMLVGELLKQLVFPLDIVDGRLVMNYLWSAFPFQLCSTPLYVLPFLFLLPDCRLRDFAASYIMTFGLLGGIAVYIAPNSVFVGNVFLSYHSMIHHGIQILSGVYTAAYYRRRINSDFVLGAIGVFTVMFIIANLLNTVGYDLLLEKGLITTENTFNMFYISPRPGQDPIMFKEFYSRVHPAVYIAGYFVLITAGALVIAYTVYLIHKLSKRRMIPREVSDNG